MNPFFKLLSFGLATLVAVSAPVFVAEANMLMTYEIEAALEGRVKAAIAPFDPDAIVRVNIELRVQKSPLPGANSLLLDLVQQKSIESLEPRDIAKVDIRVLHTIEEVPPWLQTEISATIPVNRDRVKTSFQRMNPEAIQRLKDLSLSGKALNYSKHLPAVLFAVLAFAAISLFTIVFVLSRNSKNLLSSVNTQMKALLETLQNETSSAAVDIDKDGAARKENEQISSQISEMESDLVRSLKIESITAIFSDCFWCELDSYALWLWNVLSVQQREQLMRSWPLAENYIRSIGYLDPVPKTYHTHSAYLSPPPISNLSQADLAAFVSKSPSAWNLLTPIRQAMLPVPLNKKISYVLAPAAPVSWPQTQSKPRTMSPPLEVGEVQVSDEEFLFDNPNAIPSHLRARVPSLVWLALTEASIRSRVLSELSAQQLASAWVGPERVLEVLKGSIAEKKQKLLVSYLERAKPSRSSPEFIYLFNESLRHELGTQGEGGNGQRDAA